MQSDCPIAKEASTTPVDLTTLIPMHAVFYCACLCSLPLILSERSMIVAQIPRHRPNFPSGTVGRVAGLYVSFHGQGSTEHVARCMLALIVARVVVIVYCTCGMTPVRWRREDPRQYGCCMGGSRPPCGTFRGREWAEDVGPPNGKPNLLSPAVCSQVPWFATPLGMKRTSTLPAMH